MKFINLFLFVVFSANFKAYAQNIEFKKILDDNVSCYNHANSEAPYFIYEKFQGDKLLRMENRKVQLFDENFKLIWEIKLDRVKSSNSDNYFTVKVTQDEIYIFQRGFSKYPSKTKSVFHKISADGEITSLELTKRIKINNAEAIHVFEEKVILVYSIYNRTKTYITAFDKNLEDIEKTIEIFSHYELSESEKNHLNIKKDSTIKINKKSYLFFENNNISIFPMSFSSLSNSMLFKKYNSLFISINGEESRNLLPQFFKLLSSKTQVPKYFNICFYDIIEDPINGSFNIMLHESNHSAYLLIFNAQQDLTAIRYFKIGYTIYEERPKNNNFAFPFSKNGNELFGELPQGHKVNAFEYALTLKGKSFYTIINYDEYQLLISDNITSGISEIYKIVK